MRRLFEGIVLCVAIIAILVVAKVLRRSVGDVI